jgi:uncharacterized membrane protein YgcG
MNSVLRFFHRSFVAGLILIVAGAASPLMAQQPPPPQPAAPVISAAQLDDLVAPVALYPDPVLSQVLVASTYPLEVVEAEQWLQHNNGLSGANLMNAAKQQNWDASVQALVAFPDVLAKLNQDVRWTTDLGNAFLAQQADTMRAVQHMRALAQANGKLSTTPQQTVSDQTQDGQSAIAIEPANPQVVYVPTYDPAYIWGPPIWGAYPALYYPPFGFGFYPGFNIGLFFGGWGGWGGWGWGSNWFGNTIVINHGFFGHYGFHGAWGAGSGVWAHNPDHRLGVPYSNRQLSSRFGAASRQSALGMGARDGIHQPYGFNPGATRSPQSGVGQANRVGSPGPQGSPGVSSQRGFQASPNVQSRQNFQSAPSAPHFNASPSRGFSGGAGSFGGGAHGFGGGGFGGGGHSFGGGGGHGGGGRR